MNSGETNNFFPYLLGYQTGLFSKLENTSYPLIFIKCILLKLGQSISGILLSHTVEVLYTTINLDFIQFSLKPMTLS